MLLRGLYMLARVSVIRSFKELWTLCNYNALMFVIFARAENTKRVQTFAKTD